MNVLIHSIIKKNFLSMRSYSNVKFIFYEGERRLFLDACENVEIFIDGFKDLHHIFGIKAADHQLVLGQPCLLQMRVELIYMDGEVKARLFRSAHVRKSNRKLLNSVFFFLNFYRIYSQISSIGSMLHSEKYQVLYSIKELEFHLQLLLSISFIKWCGIRCNTSMKVFFRRSFYQNLSA